MPWIDAKKTTSEQTIIALCLKRLRSSKPMLLEFLEDIKKGKHKEWSVYIQAKGEYKLRTHVGRLKPAPKPSIGTRNAYIWYVCTDREKEGTKFIPQLRLDKCKTEEQKVNMIMNSEIPPEIKVDLLSVIKLT